MSIENILITDYHCASNRGDAAILEGEISAFKKEFPEANVTVQTEYPDSAELLHDVDVIQQYLTPFEPGNFLKTGASAFALLDAIAKERLGLPSLPLGDLVKDRLTLQPYYDADLVVSTGGQFMTDAYYPAKIGVLAGWYLAYLLDTPFVIYAQSLGPFGRPYRTSTRHVMNQAELIITRDYESKRHLDEISISTEVYVGVDAAWAMPLAENQRSLTKNFQPSPSLPESPEGPLISVSVRRWSHFETEDGEEKYFQAVAETLSELIENENAQIVFLSTCTGLAGYHTDDRVAASKVRNRINSDIRDRTTIVTEEMTPQQLVSLYRQVDLHIGTRMHSCLLAMLAETPVVAIEYQFKTSGMMEQFNLENYVLNIDGLNSTNLLDTIQDALYKREVIEQILEDRVPKQREAARENARYLRRSIEDLCI